MGGPVGPTGSGGAQHGQHHDQFGRRPGGCDGAGRGERRVGLGDFRIRGLALEGRVDVNLELAFETVGAEAFSDGLPLTVADHGEGSHAVGEGTAHPVGRQRKDHNGAGDRLVVLILYLDDGCAGRTLADVVGSPLAFDDNQVQHRGSLGGGGDPKSQQDREATHGNLRRHYGTGGWVARIGGYWLTESRGGWRGGSGACMDGGADAPVRGRPPGRPIAGRLGTNSASEERVQGVRPTNSAATGMSYSNVMWMRAG